MLLIIMLTSLAMFLSCAAILMWWPTDVWKSGNPRILPAALSATALAVVCWALVFLQAAGALS